MNTLRLFAAELIGTAFLLATVVGSGIMGQQLAGGDALTLLANALATGAGLIALILTFGPVSGAHFNPLVTIMAFTQGKLSATTSLVYVLAQFIGALLGVLIAHLMFSRELFELSSHVRSGPAQLFSECVASFGLLMVIQSCARYRPDAVAGAVAAYITAAYWFTASTSFANPAVTLARSLTDSFAGIRPLDVPGFMLAQLAGMALALLFFRWLAGKP